MEKRVSKALREKGAPPVLLVSRVILDQPEHREILELLEQRATPVSLD